MGRPSQEAQPRDHTAEGILHSGHLELFIDEYIFGYATRVLSNLFTYMFQTIAKTYLINKCTHFHVNV